MFFTEQVDLVQHLQGQALNPRQAECALISSLCTLGAPCLLTQELSEPADSTGR